MSARQRQAMMRMVRPTADGYGARLRQQQREQAHQKQMAESRRWAALTKLDVPVLTSQAKVKEIANEPEHPFYLVSAKVSLRGIGKALFGGDGYNRMSKRINPHDIGAHFDDYRGLFAPWTIVTNANAASHISVSGVFLPPERWAEYQAEYDLVEKERDATAQNARRRIGEAVLKAADPIYYTIFKEERLLIWQGGTTEALPPSVHDIKRAGNDYTLLVRQLDDGEPAEGFVEI